jgi:lipoprotein Spr
MKKKLLNTALASILGAVIACSTTSCNSAHELMNPPVSACAGKPQFMDGMSLAGNQKPAAMTTALADNRKTGSTYVKSISNFLNLKYAGMLGVLPQLLTNDLLYTFIDEWYGTRYRFGGADKGGIDCSAFVQRLYERVFNVNLLRTAVEQFSVANAVWDKEDLREGDLVFFQVKSRRISHVGIYLINNFFVHSSTSNGVMISNLNESYWKKYFARGGRIVKNTLKIDVN